MKKQKGKGSGAPLIPLAKVVLRVFGSGKKKENMARRNRILIVKGDFPKIVTLPNDRTFLALYKQTNGAHFPANIHLAKVCKQLAVLKRKRRRP